MSEQVSVDELKKIVSAIAQAASAIFELKEVDFDQLKGQILDLDLAEKSEIAELFKQKLNIESDDLEQSIEKGFDVLLTVAALVSKFA